MLLGGRNDMQLVSKTRMTSEATDDPITQSNIFVVLSLVNSVKRITGQSIINVSFAGADFGWKVSSNTDSLWIVYIYDIQRHV